MEGFLSIRLRPWLRRLITRLIAIVPAVLVICVVRRERARGRCSILSQVILSLQLPFAVFPLLQFTSDRAKMGRFALPLWMRALAWPVARRDRGPERVAPVPDVRRPVRWIDRSVPCTSASSSPSSTRPPTQTILAHVQPLARLTQARLLLLHVADGWAARAYDELQLRESEEMRDDREYLEDVSRPACGRRDSTRSGGSSAATRRPQIIRTAARRSTSTSSPWPRTATGCSAIWCAARR